MPTPSIETARGWLGRVVVDRDGDKVGEVVDIYLDNQTGRPEWAVVRTGLFGMRSTFVPLAEAAEVGGQLQVPHHKGQLKKAPNVEPDGHLSEAEEAELYRHYGLDYDTVTLDDDAAAAQPRAAAAGRPDDPGRNQQGEASSPEPASDRPNAQDEPSATAGSQPAGPAGQDRFPVGEGVSRPFVYETPGRPAGGASNLRRQPGQMRLRRYLVTEVVTDTGSGQRHEVRVHSEPVPDARVDVDEVLTSPDRQDGLPGQEPTGPDRNDWFSDETEPPR